jgi:hypothetical protein
LQNTAGKISTTDGTRTFCGSEDPRSKAAANAAMHVLGFMPSELTPLCTVKHSITRYRITLEVFHVHLGGASYTSRHNKNKMGRRGPSSAVALLRRVETPPSGNNGVWLPLTKLDLLAFTAAHKKILTHLKHDGRRLR